MSTIVTFASGKGGVGKSVVLSNVGLALANRGRRVVVADLDVGGSNLATLFGALSSLLSRLQTGFVRSYAMSIVVGTLLVAIYLFSQVDLSELLQQGN